VGALETTTASGEPVTVRSAGLVRRLSGWLGSPIDAASLGAFRILFGGLMVVEVLHYLTEQRVERFYIQPKLHFPYELFPFVVPWPGRWMYAHLIVMGLSALGIALGFLYRWCAATFLLTYAWMFLIDKAYYNNHYYLIILLALLLSVMPADRWASLDQRRRRKAQLVPFWTIFLLRAQIVLVYFYGGIAKLNADWLAGEPMRSWLHERSSSPFVGPFFATEAAAWLFTYGGLLFDLSVGFLLLVRRTRLLAVLVIVFFHLTNAWIFTIGIFPFLMLATTLLFFPPDWPRRVLAPIQRYLGQTPAPSPPARPQSPASPLVLALLSLYLLIQMAVPLRHWLYPGHVSWTEDGHRFSWHMKLRDKEGRLKLWVTDPKSGRTWQVDYRKDLNLKQRGRVEVLPDVLLQYVGYLKQRLREEGIDSAIIRAEARVSLNRRRDQPLVDPDLNLAAIEPSLLAPSWWVAPFDPAVERVRLGLPVKRIPSGLGRERPGAQPTSVPEP
jgi:hypothetical protein